LPPFGPTTPVHDRAASWNETSERSGCE
jgi:hypothetical protein